MIRDNAITMDLWLQYIRGELESEMEEQLEDLLRKGDDETFQSYMQAMTLSMDVKEDDAPFPNLQDAEAFTDSVMASILLLDEAECKDKIGITGENVVQVNRSLKRSRVYRNQPLFHYIIAASITLILLTSGMFDLLTSSASHVNRAIKEQSGPSFSETMMDATHGWMNRFK